jgi:predicted nucleic acid-binding protein
MLAIGVKIIRTSHTLIGDDTTYKKSSRGYKGSKVDSSRLGSETIRKRLKKLQGSTESNPIGRYKADLMTLQTAINKNMDYIVTGDKHMKNNLLRNLRHTKLRALDKDKLLNFLNTISN